MKLDEVFNDEYNLSVFARKVERLIETRDTEYLNKVRGNVVSSIAHLKREIPGLKRSIVDGMLELKPLYTSLASLLHWLEAMMGHMDTRPTGPGIPSNLKDHPFWGKLQDLA